MVGRSKKQSFASICGRVKAKLDGWKEKFISQVGKEILLKAVVQALPTYCMSIFRLPQTLCTSLNSFMSIFWWGHKTNQGRVHWMSWKKLGAPKNRGGMGFRVEVAVQSEFPSGSYHEREVSFASGFSGCKVGESSIFCMA